MDVLTKLSHLDFRVEDAEMMIWTSHEAQRVRLGGPTAPVPEQIRLDGINHTLVSRSQGCCIYCKSNTRLMCSNCDKRLHKKVCRFSLPFMDSWIFWVLTKVYLLYLLSLNIQLRLCLAISIVLLSIFNVPITKWNIFQKIWKWNFDPLTYQRSHFGNKSHLEVAINFWFFFFFFFFFFFLYSWLTQWQY